MVIHTGTISEKEADARTEAIKSVMAETGLNFGDAVNEYIRRSRVAPGCEGCTPKPVSF